MFEQRLPDGWGSYYTMGRTCHLLPVACLLLPLVSFMAVITERMHGQTAPSEIPISHIKHMQTETQANWILTFHSKPVHRQDRQGMLWVRVRLARSTTGCVYP